VYNNNNNTIIIIIIIRILVVWFTVLIPVLYYNRPTVFTKLDVFILMSALCLMSFPLKRFSRLGESVHHHHWIHPNLEKIQMIVKKVFFEWHVNFHCIKSWSHFNNNFFIIVGFFIAQKMFGYQTNKSVPKHVYAFLTFTFRISEFFMGRNLCCPVL